MVEKAGTSLEYPRGMTSVIENDIYLPASEPQRLAKARRDLIEFFGGLTDSRFRQEGVWRFGQTVIQDKITVWRILSDRGDDGDRFMRDLRERLERELNQTQILLVRRRVEIL